MTDYTTRHATSLLRWLTVYAVVYLGDLLLWGGAWASPPSLTPSFIHSLTHSLSIAYTPHSHTISSRRASLSLSFSLTLYLSACAPASLVLPAGKNTLRVWLVPSCSWSWILLRIEAPLFPPFSFECTKNRNSAIFLCLVFFFRRLASPDLRRSIPAWILVNRTRREVARHNGRRRANQQPANFSPIPRSKAHGRGNR